MLLLQLVCLGLLVWRGALQACLHDFRMIFYDFGMIWVWFWYDFGMILE